MLPPSRTQKYENLLGGISMSRKSKIDSALKVELVEKYLRDEIGIYEAARLAGISGKTTSPVLLMEKSNAVEAVEVAT